ncbi:murein biosynthesis integral membrane protein MurJ [Amycolatopsis sp. CA-126428]|uniref:murein biosynthesis integral membrane protein MurJ n=1 Tax=Amycolatopsis sp. CA-126428 TaxID=2073158 RepID=UPI000CD1334E|nr:murein biosynthesis integral membrane protein MurJ [Amycolatopsis sp. CA-126428]
MAEHPPPADNEATVFLPSELRGPHWPTRDPDVSRRAYDEFAGQIVARPPASPVSAGRGEGAGSSLARSSGRMAVASAVSRVTGFVAKLLLAAVVGAGVVNDSFTVANTLPNIVFELLFGGVLASVVVPLLVRSHDDPDGGRAYTQRLITMALVLLAVGTAVAVAIAPLFTALYVDKSSESANSGLTTALAYLLLPQILFYGLFALLSAILNAQNVFGPPAWAPVLNNVVVTGTLVVFAFVPGELTLDPVRMSDPKLLVLGLGTTLGIVAQAVVLIPALLRTGFRFRWRWGFDPRIKEFGGLAAWILGYVVVSHVGFVITTRVLTGGNSGGVTAYSYASLLFQLPYGILGVSLLTALMPRMSRAAADGDTVSLVGDLSLASRMSTVLFVPISAVLAVVGTPIGIAIFTWGRGTLDDAERLGQTLAVSAVGLLPFALVMLQLRVFYAMKDARTPTLIMLVMTAVKIPLLLLCRGLLDGEHVVYGVMLVNGAGFVVGAVLGQVWLWVRLGHLRSKRSLRVGLITLSVSGLGVVAAVLAGRAVPASLGVIPGAWVKLPVQGLLGMAVPFGLLALLKLPEFTPVTRRVAGLRRRLVAR